jgi:hypothetical protein
LIGLDLSGSGPGLGEWHGACETEKHHKTGAMARSGDPQGSGKMSTDTGVGVNQSGKSGGDALGSAFSGAGAAAGSGLGVGQAAAAGFSGAGASGYGIGGSAGAGAGAVGAAGGDVSDNTSIGSININS